MRTETLGNTSDNAIKEYSSPKTKPLCVKLNLYAYRNAWQHIGQRNKGILVPLHRHRLQQEQNHFGTQFAGLAHTGTKVQILTLLLLLQAIDWGCLTLRAHTLRMRVSHTHTLRMHISYASTNSAAAAASGVSLDA